MRCSQALRYRAVSPIGGGGAKWNWRKESPKWWDMSKALKGGAATQQKGIGSVKFRRTKAMQHFNVGTAAERNLAWENNTPLHILREDGFETTVENPDALSARNAMRKYNADKDSATRASAHLFQGLDKHVVELDPEVAPALMARFEHCARPQAAVPRDALEEALLASNHELPLAAYHVNAAAAGEAPPSAAPHAPAALPMDERLSGAGVVSADVIEGHGGAVVVIGCDSVGTSLSDAFLNLAKEVSRTAATLSLDVDDAAAALLTTQIHDSDEFVGDALAAFSKRVGEAVVLKEVSLVPWPTDGLLGWFVNNPRGLHPGQGGAICFTLCLFEEVEFRFLEPEWKLRLQETFPHAVAQHCCLEPLWFGRGGRILKQPFLVPLPQHELLRYPSGAPTLFDWMQDQCVRHKITLTRFGLINTQLGLPTAKTWVSFSMEEHRYGKFATAVDPTPDAKQVQAHDYSKGGDAEPKKDLAEEELWFNEPGQKSFDELEKQGDMPSGFATDDELMNSKQF